MGIYIVISVVLFLLLFFGRKRIGKFLAAREERPYYYKDYGKGPFPTGRPRKERGH